MVCLVWCVKVVGVYVGLFGVGVVQQFEFWYGVWQFGYLVGQVQVIVLCDVYCGVLVEVYYELFEVVQWLFYVVYWEIFGQFCLLCGVGDGVVEFVELVDQFVVQCLLVGLYVVLGDCIDGVVVFVVCFGYVVDEVVVVFVDDCLDYLFDLWIEWLGDVECVGYWFGGYVIVLYVEFGQCVGD